MNIVALRRLGWIRGLILLAIISASAALLSGHRQHAADRKVVERLTQKTKTVCVGRFLIDLPVEAEVKVGRSFVSGFDFASDTEESEDDFVGRLHQFEDEVAARARNEGRRGMELIRLLNTGAAHGKLFVYDRRPARTVVDRKIVEIEDVDLQGMFRHPGLSITASAQGAALEDWKRLEFVLKKTRPLDDEAIPTENGFCIAHVLISDPYEHRGNESVVMFAGLPGHPDVNIVFSSMAGAEPAPGLLERNAKAAQRGPLLARLALTSLREGARTVNGLEGEELLIRAREPNFTTGYSFQWEMAGGRDDIFAPFLTLELESGTNPVSGGKPVQSTLSEEAMLDLWERIAGSIRVRPTAPTSS